MLAFAEGINFAESYEGLTAVLASRYYVGTLCVPAHGKPRHIASMT